MTIYSQRDHIWGDKQLGNSGCTMTGFGCLVTDIAQMLLDAGYPVTPGDLVDHLNSINGFTDNNYPQGGGLLIWGKLSQAYPQIHYHGTNPTASAYEAIQGTWGRYLHFVLRNLSGVVTEPFFGKEGEPLGYKENGYVIYLTIDPSQTPTPPPVLDPAQSSPNPSPVNGIPQVNVNLQPDAEWDKLPGGADRYQNREEVKILQDRLVAAESIPDYDRSKMEGEGHGYFGPITVKAVIEFQVAKNIMAPGSSYPATYAAGFVGIHTRSALNV